ncbi:hypothetical protein TRM7557_02895 [Tritonibacter multivorans]|uniref:Uncharacterized protein n=1 Tax=Tritonibacter multivorans TaxID=928856 RepID=A0A0P1GVN4_9RHOB|nr:hypothetical protein [Tritonibacter multivorans]MDA7420966.1 hypothetical protein [Tritonibacter multivorans]CUH80438.1 hypothetical protein TRM7557_02895 [Tritonibacter multivorans]SFC80241.1 hypothetical protein SAMN04488049_104178 [Tritonibacter multivorans]
MTQTEMHYPTLAELKAVEAEVHRLRGEAARDMARSLFAFVLRLIKSPFAHQQTA